MSGENFWRIGEVGVVLRVEVVVGLGLVARAEQLALVRGDAGVEHAPVDVRPAARLAGVEHVADAGVAPRRAVGFEHPVGVRERGGQCEFRIIIAGSRGAQR